MSYDQFPHLKHMGTGIDTPLIITAVLQEILDYPKSEYVDTEGRTLENIAHSLYRDRSLWVVLAEYNRLVNPLNLPDRIYYLPVALISKLSWGS